MLHASGGVGFEGVSAGCGAVVMTTSWGGLKVELSLGGASLFGSEWGLSNAPLAESVDFVNLLESPPGRNSATRANVPAPISRRSSLQNQSTGFAPRSQNVAPSMGTATASLEALEAIMRSTPPLGYARQASACPLRAALRPTYAMPKRCTTRYNLGEAGYGLSPSRRFDLILSTFPQPSLTHSLTHLKEHVGTDVR